VRMWPLPVLARIPLIPRWRRRQLNSPLEMSPAVREGFRTLHVQLDEGNWRQRTIMVTSASTGDGKTTSAINLALAIAAAGQRVILMDFDLRKPSVSERLNLTWDQGLVSLVASDAKVRDVLVPAPDLPLLIVPSGNDAFVAPEALARRLPAILEEATSLADYVVLDTAPLGEVSDALRIANQVDDIIIVARPGHTKRGNLEVTRELLERTGRTPRGLVLIGSSPKLSGGYYYGYGYAPEGDESRRRMRPSLRG